jgi:hypothetical protein
MPAGSFFEAEAENPKAVRFVLRIISWLYEAEARWDGHSLTAGAASDPQAALLYPSPVLAVEGGDRFAGAGAAEVRVGKGV